MSGKYIYNQLKSFYILIIYMLIIKKEKKTNDYLFFIIQ